MASIAILPERLLETLRRRHLRELHERLDTDGAFAVERLRYA